MEGASKGLALNLPPVTVWAAHDSPRLRYVLDWLLRERLGLDYRLTHNKEEAASAQHCIAYGWMEGAVSVHATGLLREEHVHAHPIQRREWNGLHTLYFDASSPCDIQFDMLAGIFYLLTRYEEYFDFPPDRHNRYPATESILYTDGVLERPIVDEWVEALRLFLQDVWDITIPPPKFSYQPTYDIDIAWSYQGKGWRRTLGAALRDLATMNRSHFAQRIRVLRRQEPDPYNAFVWLATLHMNFDIRPTWFFLAAGKPSRFDKNISPRHPHMASVIRAFSEGAETGIHPSYYSDKHPEKLAEEKAVMETIVGKPMTISRQHYIKLRFPQTYYGLIALGIEADYSMGYSTHFGFRAGTGSSFPWYDLAAEKATALRVHPFAFMDTTGHYDLGLSADAAFRRLDAMAEKLIGVNSRLITVMHNFSLGTDKGWSGWRKEYEDFLKKIDPYTHNAGA